MRATSTAPIAGAVYFALVFAAGFVLGTLRTLVLEPRFGAPAAVLIELPVMLAIAWLACGWIVERFAVDERAAARIAMGSIAFALLIAAEIGLTLLFGRTLADFLTRLGSPAGLLGLAGQVLFGLMPLWRTGIPAHRQPDRMR